MGPLWAGQITRCRQEPVLAPLRRPAAPIPARPLPRLSSWHAGPTERSEGLSPRRGSFLAARWADVRPSLCGPCLPPFLSHCPDQLQCLHCTTAAALGAPAAPCSPVLLLRSSQEGRDPMGGGAGQRFPVSCTPRPTGSGFLFPSFPAVLAGQVAVSDPDPHSG